MDKLIDAFWRGQATAEERLLLLEKLRQLESNEQSWLSNAILESLTEEETFSGNEDWFAAMQAKLHEQAGIMKPVANRKTKLLSLPVLKWAAAVAVLVTTTLTVYYTSRKTTGGETDQIAEAVVPVRYEQYNATTTLKTVLMPDSSEVLLEPGAAVSYYSDYGESARQIVLDRGSAGFSVRKNRQRPFSVSAQGVRTTALGTTFNVRIADAHTVKVKLIEGVVVVDGADASSKYQDRQTLRPGQEIAINVHSGVHTLTDKPSLPVVREPASTGKKSKPVEEEGLSFTQQSLTTVFDRLVKQYNVKIQFDIQQMNNRWFTGSFESTDQLDQILSTICQMNDLIFSWQNNSWVISEK
ncbi:MAG: FecR domain-containing protein [Chitinophagaceae bacterium]|nr:FecR domain-containing protein [Chitinophagaceae bacterium]